MRIDRFEFRSPKSGRVFDSGDRDLGNLVLIHGGGVEAADIVSEFLDSLISAAIDSAHRSAPPPPSDEPPLDEPHRESARAPASGCLTIRTADGSTRSVARSDSGAVEAAPALESRLPSIQVFRLIHALRPASSCDD
ncbi:MAG: hypothetical protein KDC38_20465, partial [Planctomycetes bacterium]|nr:hypothetical protein [Planctomycetota bacterium]